MRKSGKRSNLLEQVHMHTFTHTHTQTDRQTETHTETQSLETQEREHCLRSSYTTLHLVFRELNFLIFMNQSSFSPLVTPVILLLRPDS